MILISKLKKPVPPPLEQPESPPPYKTITDFNEAIDSLEQQHYIFVEELWEKIGSKFSEGIKQLSKETGVSYEALIQILADGNINSGAETTGRRAKSKDWLLGRHPSSLTFSDEWKKLRFRVRQYLPEVLAAIIIGTLLALLVLHAFRPRDAVFVKSNLPAFHVITDQDVETGLAIVVPGAFASKEEVKGRYLLQQVTQGDRLYATQMSKLKLSDKEVTGRQILTLPVKTGVVSQTLAPLDHVNLYFSPRQIDKNNAGEVFSVEDVIVLAINRQGEASSLVVAIRADMSKVAALLGTYDLLISQPIT
jgi:hypothetical protein